MSDSPKSIVQNLHLGLREVKRSRWIELFLKCVACSIVCYLFLATQCGVLIYAASGEILGSFMNPTVKQVWCDGGNWMVDEFQPLVSDEEMVQHFKKHRAGMEALAMRYLNKKSERPEGGFPNGFLEDANRLNISWVTTGGGWRVEPYSVEKEIEYKKCEDAANAKRLNISCRKIVDIVSMSPNFGRVHAANFCSRLTGAASKDYRYFPGESPRIVGDKFQVGISTANDPVFDTGAIVVNNTNHIHQNKCQYQKIDQNWFITVC